MKILNEIEAGNEFVVVSSVEIEPTDTQKKEDPSLPPAARASGGAPTGGVVPGGPNVRNPNFPGNPAPIQAQAQVQAPAVAGPKGKTHGETVSLRLEMAAYFRRPNTGLLTPQ
jgi:hypothetical protein